MVRVVVGRCLYFVPRVDVVACSMCLPPLWIVSMRVFANVRSCAHSRWGVADIPILLVVPRVCNVSLMMELKLPEWQSQRTINICGWLTWNTHCYSVVVVVVVDIT